MTQEQATPPGFWQRVEQAAERAVAKAMRSGALRNASIGEGGTFTIKGGKLRVMYPEGQGGGLGVYFGDLQSPVDGSYLATGLLVQHPNGGDIASIDSTQIILRDSERNPVAYTPAGGVGLVRPYVGGMFFRQRFTDWTVQTTSTDWEGLWKGEIHKQHARLSVAVQASMALSGQTGEVRVLVDGVQMGAAQSVAWALSVKLFGPEAVAGDNMKLLTVEIQGRVTGGSGAALKVEPLHLLGRG